jgi:YfiH family protein
MALTVGTDVEDTPARRRAVCESLGLSFDKLTVGEQVHGSRVAVVTGSRIGCGRDKTESRIAGVDGLVTDEPGVPLMALSADCALVLLYDPVRRAIGLSHAGWRGTARGITSDVLRHMIALYECRVENMLAAVSPCAGPCCYEVKDDVVTTFAAAGHDAESIVQVRNGKMYLDLPKANALQLLSLGLSPDRIDLADVCTVCSDDYYSHRRAPGEGHFAMIAALI